MKFIVLLKKLYLGKTEDTKIQLFRSTQSSQYSYLFDLGFYLLLVNVFSVPYLLARFISYGLGTTVIYFFSIIWIFPSRNVSNQFLEYGSFMSVGIIGAAGNVLLLAFFTEIVGIYHLYGNIVSGMIIFSFNFFTRKFLLFRRRNKD
jgi:putative flippase GtrA